MALTKGMLHKTDGTTESVEFGDFATIATLIKSPAYIRPCYDGKRVFVVYEEARMVGQPINQSTISISGYIQGTPIFGDFIEMDTKDFHKLPLKLE